MTSWERRSRKTLLDSPFMSVWQDTVELPTGHIIEDYSLAKLPDGITVVATDEEGNLIAFDEYKYAVDETILTLPAGGIDKDETPVQAAARELLEETGYESTELEQLGELFAYPSKIQHTNFVVRAKNARRVSDTEHGAEETIGEIQLIPIEKIRELRLSGKFNTTALTAALALAFPDNF